MPEVDLFLRPSGEQRTSNFLIWQSAYAEMIFLDTLWPDFDRRHLWYACELYAQRDRRFGGALPNPVAPASSTALDRSARSAQLPHDLRGRERIPRPQLSPVARILRRRAPRFARGPVMASCCMTVRANGLDVRGSGSAARQDGPPVLLLHGFPQHGGMWDGVVPALHAAGLRTYAPDQRGYSPGARPSDVDGYPMLDCVADAVALLDALGVDRADVVGHDWGSVVAWHLAVSHAGPGPHVDRGVRAAPGGGQPGPPRRRQRPEGALAYMLLFAQPGKAERGAAGGRRAPGCGGCSPAARADGGPVRHADAGAGRAHRRPQLVPEAGAPRHRADRRYR